MISLVPRNGDLTIISLVDGALAFSNQSIADGDDDGLPSWFEELYGFDDSDSSDAELDADSDGLTNLQEFEQRTDPTEADTDQDGLIDG